MGRQHGSAATVTNFHTDSRASLRSAAGSSACPRCAAGRYAAGIKRASDGWWEERSHQFMIRRCGAVDWRGRRPDMEGWLSTARRQGAARWPPATLDPSSTEQSAGHRAAARILAA